jgi:hypothetical protein
VAAQEEGGEGAEDGEETSTQRSRRKKRELAAFESRGAKLKAVPDEPPPDDEEGEEGAGAPSGPPADAPCWPEVARALEGSPKELLLERQAGQEGRAWQVDPALFRCTSLNLLKLALKGADAAAPKPLRAVPDDLRFLTGQPPRRLLARFLRSLLTPLPPASRTRAAHPHLVQQRAGGAARCFWLAHGALLRRCRHERALTARPCVRPRRAGPEGF